MAHHRYNVEPDEIIPERSGTAPFNVTQDIRASGATTGAIDHVQTRKAAVKVLPSVTEVAVYTFLGAGIASAVFIVGERPYWHVVLVVLAAVVVVLLSALVSHRNPPRAAATSRHGRRRRS